MDTTIEAERVERGAKALYETVGKCFQSKWENANETTRKEFSEFAKACLEAADKES